MSYLSHHLERVPDDVSAIRCSNCEQWVRSATVYADGYVRCAACKAKQDAAYEAETGWCAECGYQLAYHRGGCPDELTARGLGGDR